MHTSFLQIVQNVSIGEFFKFKLLVVLVVVAAADVKDKFNKSETVDVLLFVANDAMCTFWIWMSKSFLLLNSLAQCSHIILSVLLLRPDTTNDLFGELLFDSLIIIFSDDCSSSNFFLSNNELFNSFSWFEILKKNIKILYLCEF